MTYYGIDLGMTSSCIAVYHDSPEAPQKNLEIISNEEAERTTPSVVCFTDDNVYVGKEAIINSKNYPKSTFCFTKYFTERTFKVNTNRYKDVELSPEQISAFVLDELKEAADSSIKDPIGKAVITVPANFNGHQKLATKEAAMIAGLDPIAIINEPIAACIEYMSHTGVEKEDRYVLVYNFNGLTLDVSLVHIKGEDLTIIDTSYESGIGGKNIESFVLKNQIEEVENNIENDTQMESKLVKPIIDLFERSKIPKEKLTDVVLVGEPCKSPIVKDIVKNETGKEVFAYIHPSEGIAKGAAIYGALKCGATVTGFEKINIHEVVPSAIGICYAHKRIEPSIQRNTPYDEKGEAKSDWQCLNLKSTSKSIDNIQIVISEGDESLKETNRIGKIVLSSFAVEGEHSVNINFMICANVNGDVSVFVKRFDDKDDASTKSFAFECPVSLDIEKINQMRCQNMSYLENKNSEE